MNLLQKINTDLKKAMLEHNEVKKLVISGIKSAITYKKVELKTKEELSDNQIMDIISTQIKQRDDAINLYLKANDQSRAKEEQAQRDILASYLPKPLSLDELASVVKKVIQSGNYEVRDFGKIMSEVKAWVGYRATGAEIANAIKRELK